MSIYNGLFSGSLIGVFWLGMFTNRANGVGTTIGIVTSAIAIFYTLKDLLLYIFLFMD